MSNLGKRLPPKPEGEETRKKIMDFLSEHTVTIAPVSIRDIADHLGTSTSVVMHHLERLEAEGKIYREKEKARMIEVL